MYNHVAIWMYLIGTAENARKLRARIDGLKPPPLDAMFGIEPRQCPLTVLYGAETSRKAYADARLRPALDLWDTDYVEAADLRRWCLEIERGHYTGPVFKPSMPISWRPASLRASSSTSSRAPAVIPTDGLSRR